MKKWPRLDNLTLHDALHRLAGKARLELTAAGITVEGRTDADLIETLKQKRHREAWNKRFARKLSNTTSGLDNETPS